MAEKSVVLLDTTIINPPSHEEIEPCGFKGDIYLDLAKIEFGDISQR